MSPPRIFSLKYLYTLFLAKSIHRFQALHILRDKAVKFDRLLTEGLEKLAKQKEQEEAERREKEKEREAAVNQSIKEKRSPKVKASKKTNS